MMYDYDYVLVGGGMAADSAARAIRKKDPDGSIAILGDEADPPYERPPLTKALWTDSDLTPDDALLGTASATGTLVQLETRVVSIDREERSLQTDVHDHISYRKLLLATGGTPRQLDHPASERVIYFRTLADYRKLRAVSGAGKHVVVVGGGFIGTELACGLAVNDTRVTVVIPDDEVGARTYPPAIRKRLAAGFAQHDVTVLTGRQVTSIADDDSGPAGGVVVTLADDSRVTADAVVAGLGIEPNIELARDSGLTLDHGGVVVDEFLQTSSPYIYAAGDIAVYPDKILGRRRVEHVDQAQSSGEAAGRNMAGAKHAYEHTPLFYSDLFDDGYEAVGTLDTRLDMVEDWAPGEPGAQGVVYYLKQGAVQGVLLWNVWDATDKAREVLKEFSQAHSVEKPDDLLGRIPTG